MVVKVQQSLHSSDGEKSVLIYDETKKFYVKIKDDVEQLENILKLMGTRSKVYFKVEMVEGEMQIVEEVEAQNW